MENKRIDTVFGFIMIAFLLVVIILIRDINSRRAADSKEYASVVSALIKNKNNKIKILSEQLAAQEKENADLKSTLASTKSDLDSLSKKLVPPAPAAAVAHAAAAAAK